jgi:hypothetical protein
MSDTTFYIVAFIVIAHFIAAFIFLVNKLSGPTGEDSSEEENAFDDNKSTDS